MDGVDPLPDQDPTEGPNGDESARLSVQPEAGAEYLRNAEADCVHERLGPNRPKSNPALSLATAPRSPAGYTRERLTTRFHTASVDSGVDWPVSRTGPYGRSWPESCRRR